MSDYIDRQTAIQAVMDLPDCPNGYSDTYDKACIIGLLEEVPSIGAVEVVRCKDCYHYDEESEKCILNNSEMKPTDYCSYGSK